MEKSLMEFDFEKGSSYSPLVLAYIGDAVFELYVRSAVIEMGNTPVNKMHKRSAGIVKAKSQSELVDILMPYLTDEEIAVYKRGRNAHSYTSAKNADIIDYRRATGLEALLGFLYIEKRKDRLEEIIKICLDNKFEE